MTVGELISKLENYDKDMPICIGMYQSRGLDYCYGIEEIEEVEVNRFYGGTQEFVALIEGYDFGSISGNDY